MFAPISNVLKNLFILVVTHSTAFAVGIITGAIGFAALQNAMEEQQTEDIENSESPAPAEL